MASPALAAVKVSLTSRPPADRTSRDDAAWRRNCQNIWPSAPGYMEGTPPMAYSVTIRFG